MSWHFLQEQEEASWEASSLDGAPSALLSLMPTAAGCCSPDSGTDSCRDSRSGTMCRPSTEDRGGEASMWSAGGFHAKTSPPAEQNLDWKARVPGCGERWPESLAKFDPATHSWRTRQHLLFGGGCELLAILPRWGMTADGELWDCTMLEEERTDAKDCGYWPTPVASEKNDGMARVKDLARLYKGDRVARFLSKSWLKSNLVEPESRVCPNPCWQEWRMQWPIGLTDCAPLETANVQAWLRSHGVCSEGQCDE